MEPELVSGNSVPKVLFSSEFRVGGGSFLPPSLPFFLCSAKLSTRQDPFPIAYLLSFGALILVPVSLFKVQHSHDATLFLVGQSCSGWTGQLAERVTG